MLGQSTGFSNQGDASMKVPPKRKGNYPMRRASRLALWRLNESPSEKEGKSSSWWDTSGKAPSLNESPSEKEGKWRRSRT